jgi:hypothetical protein
MRRTGSPGLVVACGLAWTLAGCGDGPYLLYEERFTTDGVEKLVGSGCFATQDGMSSGSAGVAGGAGTLPPYSVQHLAHDGGFTVFVRDGAGNPLAQREFGERFLEDGKHDVLRLELGADVLRLDHWGGTAEDCNHVGADD